MKRTSLHLIVIGVTTACGNAEQDKTPAPPACVTQTAQMSSPLIDDFEDGDSALLQPTNRRGSWYAVNDGTGIQAPAPGVDGRQPFIMSRPGSPKSAEYALRSVGWGFSGWGATVTAGLNTTKTELCSYDVSAYSELRLQARGNGNLRVNIGTQETTPVNEGGQCASTACSDYGSPIVLSSDWQEFVVPFADITQPSWAAPSPWHPETVVRLTFWVEQGDFEFWIDDVEFH